MTTATDSLHPKGLSDFPRDSRIWLFGFDKPLNEQDRHTLSDEMNSFIGGWQTHGDEVAGSFALLEDRFLLVVARDDVSGCSKDSLMRTLDAIERQTGTRALDGLRIFYRNSEGGIKSAGRREFTRLVEAGEVDKSTPIFNLGLTKLSEFDNGLFEQALADSVFHGYLSNIQ